jgi:hypothetical protein
VPTQQGSTNSRKQAPPPCAASDGTPKRAKNAPRPGLKRPPVSRGKPGAKATVAPPTEPVKAEPEPSSQSQATAPPTNVSCTCSHHKRRLELAPPALVSLCGNVHACSAASLPTLVIRAILDDGIQARRVMFGPAHSAELLADALSSNSEARRWLAAVLTSGTIISFDFEPHEIRKEVAARFESELSPHALQLLCAVRMNYCSAILRTHSPDSQVNSACLVKLVEVMCCSVITLDPRDVALQTMVRACAHLPYRSTVFLMFGNNVG